MNSYGALEAHREVLYLQINENSHWLSLPDSIKGMVLWSWPRSSYESLLSTQHLAETAFRDSCSLLNHVGMSLLWEHNEEPQKEVNSENMKPAWLLGIVKRLVIKLPSVSGNIVWVSLSVIIAQQVSEQLKPIIIVSSGRMILLGNMSTKLNTWF